MRRAALTGCSDGQKGGVEGQRGLKRMLVRCCIALLLLVLTFVFVLLAMSNSWRGCSALLCSTLSRICCDVCSICGGSTGELSASPTSLVRGAWEEFEPAEEVQRPLPATHRTEWPAEKLQKKQHRRPSSILTRCGKRLTPFIGSPLANSALTMSQSVGSRSR